LRFQSSQYRCLRLSVPLHTSTTTAATPCRSLGSSRLGARHVSRSPSTTSEQIINDSPSPNQQHYSPVSPSSSPPPPRASPYQLVTTRERLADPLPLPPALPFDYSYSNAPRSNLPQDHPRRPTRSFLRSQRTTEATPRWSSERANRGRRRRGIQARCSNAEGTAW
jgi:hypothetical protein